MDICDKKDCPLYNCFFDPTNYKKFKDQLDDYDEKAKSLPTKYQSDTKSEIMSWAEQTAMRIRTTCLACQHFNKLDMYTLFITEEAKNILVSK